MFYTLKCAYSHINDKIPYSWSGVGTQIQSVILTAINGGETSFCWEKAKPGDVQRKLIHSQFLKDHAPQEGGGGEPNRNKVAQEIGKSQEQSGAICFAFFELGVIFLLPFLMMKKMYYLNQLLLFRKDKV